MPEGPSDADLARLIAGSQDLAHDAEVVLFSRYAPRVELYGLRHLKNRAAAQDLVQQVMLRVLEALRQGRVEDPARLASFIFGTCRHVSWDMKRADQRQRKIELEHAHLPEASGPPEHSERDVVRLFGCMSSLPEREAQVVRMTFMEDREAEEIAGHLGLSSGNVRVLRHRALAKLASCLGKDDAS